jgi:hypothetical protein
MKKYLIEKLKALRQLFVMCWWYFFCPHKWKLHSSNRYNVKRGNGTKEGEVTLTLFECEICGKDKLVPSDRMHEKNTACI